MKTLTLALLIGILAVGFVSGTLSLQFHPDKLSGLVAWGQNQISGQVGLEPIRNKTTAIKRSVELQLTSDINKKMDLSLTYAEQDNMHLQDLLDKNADQNTLLNQAAETLKDLNQIDTYAKDVKAERLADLRPQMRDIFDTTQKLFVAMNGKEIETAYINGQLADITSSVETYVGRLNTPTPAVAGAQDVKTTPTPTPKPTIPIRF